MRPRGQIAVLAFASGMIAVSQAAPAPAGETAADTTAVGSLQVLYRSRIELSEYSHPFPWNDPLSEVHLSDRVAAMGLWRPGKGFELFAKGATADRSWWLPPPETRFAFEQGHASYRLGERVEARLFAFERGFGSPNRLLQIVSNGSPLISQRAEGVDLSARIAGPVRVRYTGGAFKARRDGSGLPSPNGGGDFLSTLSLRAEAGGWHAGLLLGDTRSQEFGDAVLVGIDLGIPAGPAGLVIELARSAPGSWDDLRGEKLFEVDLDRMSAGEISGGLSPGAAVGAEILGLEAVSGRYGRFGMAPGYRYVGDKFTSGAGETVPGTVESYLTAWWRHPRLAAMLTLHAADRCGAADGVDGGILSTALDTRLRGGVGTRAAVLLREGRRGSLVVSVVDDTPLSRVTATARLDDAGGGNDLSFLTEAAVNIGRRFSLGGTILLEPPARGYYSARLEMRSGRRLLARASFGSYLPASEYARLNYGPAAAGARG
ncbi:MAG: hypothetical protein PHQ19_01040, partial [Candidatus Krumholzibacteria bacterium]|nr:hypothetical protein [Candidatus Krumholzibacteria bacterium]